MDIDALIRKKFKLFQGVRSQQEDEAIYSKVYALVYDEIEEFIDESLPKEISRQFQEEIDSADPNDQEQTVKIFEKYFDQIPEYKFKLENRLNSFLNNLLADLLS